jgi:hypothetical protein
MSNDIDNVGISIIGIALLVDGALALSGCLLYPGQITGRLYDGLGSAVILATGGAMLLAHKSAVRLAIACAVILTIDQIRLLAALHFLWSAFPTAQVARAVLNICLYWVVLILYWRRAAGSL